MSIAEQLNERLKTAHPTASHFLSAMGRRLFFPRGIPVQAAEAKGKSLNATIGQITDGHGAPIPLDVMTKMTSAFDPRDVYLYSTVGGTAELRDAWRQRLSTRGDAVMSRPAVTYGLTHGLSMLGDLFTDADTTVWIPTPAWGNYRLVFGARSGANVRGYPVIADAAFTLDGLKEALSNPTGKDVLVLNFPGNPTGYTPTVEEMREIVALVRAHPGPLMVVADDAYQDMLFEDGLMERSPYYDLADLPAETHFVVKVDGATKELLFFGGRVGFLTFAADGEAAEVLEEKVRGQLRGSINVPSGLPQAMVLQALRAPDLDDQIAEVIAVLRSRYHALKQALHSHDVPYIPFNSGCFALLPTAGDPEDLRQTLLANDIGVVACGDHAAIRLAYCSVAEDNLEQLVAGIAPHLRA